MFTTSAQSSSIATLERVPSASMRLRFIPELVVVSRGESVIVDGSPELHVFETSSDNNLFTRIMPLLDGRRSLEEIIAELDDIPPRSVRLAIQSLSTWGLLEEVTDEQRDSTVRNPETLGFLRRFLAASGTDSGGIKACEDLANTEVTVFSPFGCSVWSNQLCDLLKLSGMDRVQQWDLAGLPAHARGTRSSGTAVAISLIVGNEDIPAHRKFYQSAMDRKIPWLRARIDLDRGVADLGPLLRPGDTCYDCFLEMHVSVSVSTGSTSSDSEILFFLGCVATELISMVTGFSPGLTGRGLVRYAVPAWTSTELRLSRKPGCPNCRPSKDSARGSCTALVFEDFMALESRPRQNLSSAGRTILQPDKEFGHCPRVSLNRRVLRLDRGVFEMFALHREASTRAPDIDHLGTLLLMAAGIRDPKAPERQEKRWSATAGNLGSVELFVIANNVTGLDPGTYFYQAYDHSLARFERHSGSLPPIDLIRRAVFRDAASIPDALIIFTGAFHRVSRKYGAFAYRLLALDGGVASSQTDLVARTLGLSSRMAPLWADDLIEDQLNLESFQEQVTNVVEISGPSTSEHPVPDLIFRSPWIPPSSFGGESLPSLCHRLFHESRISEQQVSPVGQAREQERSSHQSCSGAIDLPALRSGGRLVGNVLAGRRTVRNYSSDPVSLEQIASALACAQLGDQKDWPQEHDAGNMLGFTILALRIDGLHSGTYRYFPEEHRLVMAPQHLSLSQLEGLFLQSDFASAPCAIWITGNLATSYARYGNFGHRQLLLRAGAAGHRLWMGTLAAGLSGAVTAGVVPGAARRLLGIDGFEQIGLLAFLCGHAAKNFRVAGAKGLTPISEAGVW